MDSSVVEASTRSYATKSDVYLVVNGWYAVTIAAPLDLAAAKAMLMALKSAWVVPREAFVSCNNN